MVDALEHRLQLRDDGRLLLRMSLEARELALRVAQRLPQLLAARRELPILLTRPRELQLGEAALVAQLHGERLQLLHRLVLLTPGAHVTVAPLQLHLCHRELRLSLLPHLMDADHLTLVLRLQGGRRGAGHRRFIVRLAVWVAHRSGLV